MMTGRVLQCTNLNQWNDQTDSVSVVFVTRHAKSGLRTYADSVALNQPAHRAVWSESYPVR